MACGRVVLLDGMHAVIAYKHKQFKRQSTSVHNTAHHVHDADRADTHDLASAVSRDAQPGVKRANDEGEDARLQWQDADYCQATSSECTGTQHVPPSACWIGEGLAKQVQVACKPRRWAVGPPVGPPAPCTWSARAM